jgi:hypothetical protein
MDGVDMKAVRMVPTCERYTYTFQQGVAPMRVPLS